MSRSSRALPAIRAVYESPRAYDDGGYHCVLPARPVRFLCIARHWEAIMCVGILRAGLLAAAAASFLFPVAAAAETGRIRTQVQTLTPVIYTMPVSSSADSQLTAP